ncbi:MAG: phosphoglucosamine mutase [Bacteroidales bacterium]
MTLIKSISGIRGTIGGRQGENLTPVDVVKFTAAFGEWLKRRNKRGKITVVTGRDARSSGQMIANIVNATLQFMGIDVTDTGMASTPTVELAVQKTGADGGIIITASHNPEHWNALKLLNGQGEFLSAAEGEEIIKITDTDNFVFAENRNIGKIMKDDSWGSRHIDMILNLSLVDKKAIELADLKIVIDCINSVGGLIMPELIERLGVRNYILINGNPDGNFSHNPEPLPENLSELAERVVHEKANLGIAVDPDVDRLALVCENGRMFGEEYTLVAVADYVLSHTHGNTVSNMSSTRALRDVTFRYGGKHFVSPVGEINVIEEMKHRGAVIGGEGNGGIIYPELHYGRDALVGTALFLSHLAGKKISCSLLRSKYPDYFIAKKKIALETDVDFEKIKKEVRRTFRNESIDERDGVLVESDRWWVQARRSNTESVIRIYAEGRSPEEAEKLAERMIFIIKNA